ncbi:undecaprenyl-diphosphatase UppP [candidate division WWE3 bacterium RIFOXYD1_FULL_43_17]|uniref:Undecaprenyl-diphosphatase n=3 Tax=Katanobacteria TaxID=422282 RepID=A0A1F4XGP7_UNCKA|nr:MAG: Undecaprenyl-diphosphatase [candidate division WWE3 bacterium GW2011_GWE1_41_27]KKS60143.1 MAG: Undecaprenyl-diphosphatase [candidate division WWE3 bacterium GW2011_GWF2_42_42]OGC74364.1 MAG: undecaprenyl-diphosphatase UppP [candidate division WWE3 bacterium RIFOXYC1_FULL_42_17]OGC80847.1 MAG: undecaprenyl-diphosphatase UppP [candidate division WWE3 bacterium RIFOXYD1_FULL_43_17]
MTFFQSVILGIVQGLTEFIPVSSSGHLIIFPELFGWEQGGLAFDTTLHLGTLAALLVYFYKTLKSMVLSVINDVGIFALRFTRYSPEGKLVVWLLVATIPAGVTAFLFGDFLESTFRSMLSVSIFLLLGSVLMLFADRLGNYEDKSRPAPPVSFKKVITAGLFQCLALFPGVSRSGATISGGLFSGLHRIQAARISFLLSMPIIAAAGIFQLPEALAEYSGTGAGILISGFLASALSGYMAVSFLMKYLNSHGLKVFIVYRLALSLLLIFLTFY